MAERVLNPAPGFPRELGFYVSGMEELREQVREAVSDISDEKLGRPVFPGAHSIGALVMHIGEAEWYWMQLVIRGHKLTAEDRQASYWDVLQNPEAFIDKGYSADFCLAEITKIRNQTRDLLATFNDDDLERVFSFERRGENHNQTLRWILHHLVDHEAQHKGQILMLKRLIQNRER